MPLRKSLLQRLQLGQLMSSNIHKPSELEPIEDTASEPRNWDTINIYKLESIEDMPSEPKNWDTSDITKYS